MSNKLKSKATHEQLFTITCFNTVSIACIATPDITSRPSYSDSTRSQAGNLVATRRYPARVRWMPSRQK